MSINHFLNKIKAQMGIDTNTFVCLCVMVLVSLGSFGLGRLSTMETKDNSNFIIKNSNTVTENKNYIIENKTEGELELSMIDKSNTKEKMYVASKNGKLYYSRSCSGAKRILEKNAIWFSSSIEAEKSGYTLSSSCK